MEDLFANKPKKVEKVEYDASDIEVLEGLEPVRKRPGMYVGGTDIKAYHHLASEVFDNAMDEAVAGHARNITISLKQGNILEIMDDGRGIPVDPHPKYPDKSALEVILTTLHSGGKFSGKAYNTAGGLHGVGISVVNALSEFTKVEVFRDGKKYTQEFSRGHKVTDIISEELTKRQKGTKIIFKPDPEIFGDDLNFSPETLFKFVKSKAYLYKGVKILWSCDAELLAENSKIPTSQKICYPNGLQDYLDDRLKDAQFIINGYFSGSTELPNDKGRIEWCAAFPANSNHFVESYCNTVVTPLGGTHESGFRLGLFKALKNYASLVNSKKADKVTADDLFAGSSIVISIFIRDPQFQGQTKEKLVNKDVTKLVDDIIKDHFDLFLTANRKNADKLLDYFAEKAKERERIKDITAVSRKSLTQKLRLPGKLTDCTRDAAEGTELFLVEGDSAGGSAKQARNRETQAILPLRGKILNVASSTREKMLQNQEVNDLLTALGCGIRDYYDESKLRYEKVVIMTDADVDGAHIASLLMTFFFQETRGLVDNGHLYLACPPLYRISQGTDFYYAADEKEREEIVAKLTNKSNKKLDIGRFKGLGEMTPAQLKETTMVPEKRRLYKVFISEEECDSTSERVNDLMGKKPELRLKFIQESTQHRGKELISDVIV